jgi:uncharacterized membrane protein YjgN (DUF898 family)
MVQARRLRVQVPIRSLNFFNVPNPSSYTMTLGFTQPLTEMSTRRYFWGKTQLARKSDNLTAIWNAESSTFGFNVLL